MNLKVGIMKGGFQKIEVFSRWLILAILCGSCLRMFVCFQHHPLDYLFSDPLRHWANGKEFWNPSLMGVNDPILYQVYILGVQKWTGENRYLVALSCGLLSVVTPWIFYRVAREFGMSQKYSLLTWAAIVWMPSLVAIYHYFMMETLLIPLMGLGLWMAGRYLRKKTTASFLLAMFCWILASFTKATAVPLACVSMAYAWWKSGWKISYLVASLCLGMALVIPNAIRTYRELGYAAPLGNAWITKILHQSGAKTIKINWDGKSYWEFSSPVCYTQPFAPFNSWMIQRAKTDLVMSVRINPMFGERDWIQASHNAKPSAKRWGLQLWENIILFFFSPSWPDGNCEEWDGWLSFHSRWVWLPLVVLVLFWNFYEFRQKRYSMLSLAITALTFFLIFQNLVTMEGRYRKPVEPFLILNLVCLFAGAKKVSETKA